MSTSAPWTLKRPCKNPHCGHEKDSHHQGTYCCLSVHCDCRRYQDGSESKKVPTIPPGPDTPRLAETKPHADTSCTCGACREWMIKKFAGWI